MKARLETALKEIEYAKSKDNTSTGREGGRVMDVVIVNDDLERAYSLLEKVALGEEDVVGDELPSFED